MLGHWACFVSLVLSHMLPSKTKTKNSEGPVAWCRCSANCGLWSFTRSFREYEREVWPYAGFVSYLCCVDLQNRPTGWRRHHGAEGANTGKDGLARAPEAACGCCLCALRLCLVQQREDTQTDRLSWAPSSIVQPSSLPQESRREENSSGLDRGPSTTAAIVWYSPVIIVSRTAAERHPGY